jgi:biotin synthase-related radical SAM superfamily protein
MRESECEPSTILRSIKSNGTTALTIGEAITFATLRYFDPTNFQQASREMATVGEDAMALDTYCLLTGGMDRIHSQPTLGVKS